MIDKPEHHKVRVFRIKEILPHNNADSLAILPYQGYQCVIRKDDFKLGDLAAFVCPDSVVPDTEQFKFISPDTPVGEKTERQRRIGARRFRKEWSEGLVISAPAGAQEDEDVSDVLGITHYNPPDPEDDRLQGQTERGPKSAYPRSLKGWIFWLLRFIGIDFNGQTGGRAARGPKYDKPVYDVEAFKNHTKVFTEGELVEVREKIHGSNLRVVYQDGKLYVGSRKLWKHANSACIWRKAIAQHPWIEEICKSYPGHTFYGEVVPTQRQKNGKWFDYGCKDGEVKFIVFDVLDPNGNWLGAPEGGQVPVAPLLYTGPFNEAAVKALASGKSQLGNHIREGVVIRPKPERREYGLGRCQLKLVSNAFLEEQA